MSVTFLPDWFGTSPKPPSEYQAPPRSVFDKDTGRVSYYQDWRTGLVWWFCEFSQPGKQISLGHLAEQLGASGQDTSARLAKLVERGELTRDHVTNASLQQVEMYALTELGRQRQAEHSAAIVDE